jgi:adenosylhomocysteine nucleosidase
MSFCEATGVHPPVNAIMIVITFAMREESKDFLPLLENTTTRGDRADLPIVEGTFEGKKLTVVHVGVGPQSAAMRLRASGVLDGTEKPRLLICPGYAGGLAPALQHADLLLVENFSDPTLLATAASLIDAGQTHRGNLTSELVVIDSAADKVALAARTGAVGVDMETATIAQVCAEAGVPMLAIRVISDDAQNTLPVPGHLLWDLEAQKPPIGRLLWYLLRHPGRIGPFMRMIRSLGPARARLTETLRLLLAKI